MLIVDIIHFKKFYINNLYKKVHLLPIRNLFYVHLNAVFNTCKLDYDKVNETIFFFVNRFN